MRVLYLVPNLFGPPGGIARYCRLVCRSLLETGAQVRVLSLADASETPPEAWGADARLYQANHGSKRGFVKSAVVTALSLRPTIILIGHPYFSALGWFLGRLMGAPVVSFIYGIDVWQPLKPERRWALQRSDCIVSISHFTAEQATRTNGLRPARVRVLHNCLDPQFESPAQSQKAPADLSMLTVARMSRAEQYKGHDYVIRAMPALLARFPELTYRIVGDGDDRARLEDLAAREGVARSVRFHGIVSEEDLHRLYAETSLFIMPSRGEGFGFVFLEAMAQGAPAIGGNVDATPEVIADGETGYLVNPTSVEAIVAAASRLLGDETLRRRMGQAAMRRVEQEFSFPQFRQRLVAYLSELQGPSGPRVGSG